MKNEVVKIESDSKGCSSWSLWRDIFYVDL
jgi:hypothetical protein